MMCGIGQPEMFQKFEDLPTVTSIGMMDSFFLYNQDDYTIKNIQALNLISYGIVASETLGFPNLVYPEVTEINPGDLFLISQQGGETKTVQARYIFPFDLIVMGAGANGPVAGPSPVTLSAQTSVQNGYLAGRPNATIYLDNVAGASIYLNNSVLRNVKIKNVNNLPITSSPSAINADSMFPLNLDNVVVDAPELQYGALFKKVNSSPQGEIILNNSTFIGQIGLETWHVNTYATNCIFRGIGKGSSTLYSCGVANNDWSTNYFSKCNFFATNSQLQNVCSFGYASAKSTYNACNFFLSPTPQSYNRVNVNAYGDWCIYFAENNETGYLTNCFFYLGFGVPDLGGIAGIFSDGSLSPYGNFYSTLGKPRLTFDSCTYYPLTNSIIFYNYYPMVIKNCTFVPSNFLFPGNVAQDNQTTHTVYQTSITLINDGIISRVLTNNVWHVIDNQATDSGWTGAINYSGLVKNYSLAAGTLTCRLSGNGNISYGVTANSTPPIHNYLHVALFKNSIIVPNTEFLLGPGFTNKSVFTNIDMALIYGDVFSVGIKGDADGTPGNTMQRYTIFKAHMTISY